MSKIKYWVGFNSIPGIGRAKIGRLLEHFSDLQEAWEADGAELKSAGLETKSIQAIINQRPKINLDFEMEKLDRYKVKAIIQEDPLYPERLKEIYDAPPVLYVRGAIMPDVKWSLAVVGSRRATSYGKEVTERLVTDLVRNRITIISGLARGIDTVAHRTALSTDGNTIAVLASGLDIVYPAENKKMAQEIIEHGALVSDYPLGTKPKPEHFPRRNRIMSGLSLGTLVIEAAEKSGALITARMALEQDREVFAVPGSIFSAASKGSNLLIRDGAKAVIDVVDVLEELNLTTIPQQLELHTALPQNDVESVLLNNLSEGPVHIDELCRSTALPISTVSSALTMMELKGMVNQLGAMNYVAVREAKGR